MDLVKREVDQELLQEGAEAALKTVADKVISTANGMDLITPMTTPFGEMPAGQFIRRR